MKNKKLQLAALGVVLIVVIVVGVLLLRSLSRGENVSEMQETAEQGDNAAELSAEAPAYYQITRAVHEDDVPAPYDFHLEALENIFLYEDQACCFTYRAEGAVDIVSMGSGEVLCSFGPEGLLEPNMVSLCVDETGTVWELYCAEIDGVWHVAAAPCGPGVSAEDAVVLGSLEDFGMEYLMSAQQFEVWNGLILLQGDYGYDPLFLVNTETGEVNSLTDTDESVLSLCLDQDGNLYEIVVEPDMSKILRKYSLAAGEEVLNTAVKNPWDSFFVPIGLSYTEGVGLFMREKNGQIYQADETTGEIVQKFADMRVDMIDPPENIISASIYSFLIDQQGRVYFNYYTFDFSVQPSIRERDLWAAELLPVSSASPEEAVTLTITAPYQVDSIANAVRKYQQLHPAVQVVWDTQYVSREEFQLNWQEYKDQISLRIMTGDVGDLVMVTGAGLGTEVITDTDAFADLSAYLDACPFREDLIWNAVEGLRGEDGAIRGLPVYIHPEFFAWNMDLLEELGNPVDPDTVTWSELLDLALQWKEDGTDLSLTSTVEGFESNVEGFLLNYMLLANLYDAEQPDGSVQLDQPYLREMLTKFKLLHGSTQLVRTDGEVMNEKTLFVRSWSSYDTVAGAVTVEAVMERDLGFDVRITAVPKGEISQTQQGYAFCYGISAVSEHLDETWELLQYIISSDGLPANYLYTTDTLPLNTALQEKWFGTWEGEYQNSFGLDVEKFFRQLQDVMSNVPYERFDEPYGWMDAVYVPIEAYINGNSTLDKAMETANANWERFVLE